MSELPPCNIPFLRAVGVLSLLLACKADDPPSLPGCDVAEGNLHFCSELLEGQPSLSCSAYGGKPLATCDGDWSISCDVQTEDGPYRVVGYGDLEQDALDAQCQVLQSNVAAQHKANAEDERCTWSLEGDEVSKFDSISGTCSLNAATSSFQTGSSGLAFRDLGLARAASISKLELGFQVFDPPTTLTAENMSNGGFLQQFQLSVIGRVQQAEVTRNWYCSWIQSRTEPRGEFKVRIKRFDVGEDGQVERYEGSVDAKCPAAAAPAEGSLSVHVEFKGSR